MTDNGIDASFMRELGERLQPVTAAILLLVSKSTPDKLFPEAARYGGHVLAPVW